MINVLSWRIVLPILTLPILTLPILTQSVARPEPDSINPLKWAPQSQPLNFTPGFCKHCSMRGRLPERPGACLLAEIFRSVLRQTEAKVLGGWQDSVEFYLTDPQNVIGKPVA